MMLKRFCTSLLLMACLQLQAQEMLVRFAPTWNHKPVQLEHACFLPSGDSVVFETLRFYLSAITFYKDGNAVFTEAGGHHLLDAAGTEGMYIKLSAPQAQYDAVGFDLGVDSLASVSGAHSGALDPVNGMYWAWQSGYINFKLEGRSNLCATRKHIFQYHLGGYLPPNNALQHVSLKVKPGDDITVEMPLDKFIDQHGLSKNNSIMIPCADAVKLSGRLAQLLEIMQ